MNQQARRSTERNTKVMQQPSKKSAVINPKATHNVPKKHPSHSSELESQITQLQDDLKRTREQLYALYAKYQESKRQNLDLAESEEARIQELRKLFQERDRSWQSELEAVQKQRSLDLVALNSSINENQRLKIQLSDIEQAKANQPEQLKLALEIAELKYEEAQIRNTVLIQSAYESTKLLKNECFSREADLESALKDKEAVIIELKEKSVENEMLKSEISRLKVQSEQWKKAAEAALGVLTNGKNERFLEKFMNPPFTDKLDDESMKMKNNTVMKRMGELWKKGHS